MSSLNIGPKLFNDVTILEKSFGIINLVGHDTFHKQAYF